MYWFIKEILKENTKIYHHQFQPSLSILHLDDVPWVCRNAKNQVSPQGRLEQISTFSTSFETDIKTLTTAEIPRVTSTTVVPPVDPQTVMKVVLREEDLDFLNIFFLRPPFMMKIDF